MNEPLNDREVLCISQFTLYGDTRKGNRPAYVDAAKPELAEPLYDRVCARLDAAKGVFGAHMDVELVNDGPVTLLLESLGCRSMPPETASSAASPPSRRRAAAHGRWAETLQAEFLAACLRSTPRARTSARPARSYWYPDRTWSGRTYVPATRARRPASSSSATSPSRPATSTTSRRTSTAGPTSPTTADDNPDWKLDLPRRSIGGWRGEQGRWPR
jgi:hypothetical protein